MAKLDSITIRGYKSIAAIENLKLRSINIVIGPNGSGKSNFIGAFSLNLLDTLPEVGHVHAMPSRSMLAPGLISASMSGAGAVAAKGGSAPSDGDIVDAGALATGLGGATNAGAPSPCFMAASAASLKGTRWDLGSRLSGASMIGVTDVMTGVAADGSGSP